MATTVPTVVDGDDFTDDFTLAVKAATDELQASYPPDAIRHRRHRNGASIGSSGTTNMFGGSSTGTPVENVGGITFTTDGTNGYFTVPEDGTYAITMIIDPDAALTTAVANFAIVSSTTQVVLAGSSVGSEASLIRYLGAGSAIAFSVSHSTGSSRTATVWRVEIVRLAP